MGQKAHIMGAGVAILSSLSGISLIVQAAGLPQPPAHPITGILFFAIGLVLLIGLFGLVWDTITGDVRASGLLWFAVGGTGGCGVITFYSVGLFFLIAALNWALVAVVANRRQGCSVRRGVLLALVVAIFFVLVLSLVRNMWAA